MPDTKTPKHADNPNPTGEVDSGNRPHQDAALVGTIAVVTAGDHVGERVLVVSFPETGKDGWPTKALVRPRAQDAFLVDYADLKSAGPGASLR